MHGAAQTANAAPSSALEPLASRPLRAARRDDLLRQRQQAHEREPEHDEHEAGDLVRRSGSTAADRRRARAEHHEHDREADEERHARDDDPPRHAPLAEPVASTAETAER